ncbi:Vacuolar protein-sorting-associated protein 27 [Gryganskiella cystojenkinii]|nr:Vacuolar protein-sorting-associated protein 27 [Gryganskiella cystojenkinii]
MSWLWSTSAIDELVDKATSENLPAGSEDLALNLEICDQIRSKQVSPKDAAKALKRRIGHKNPNVQLLALGLTDVCVKNGGHHFLVEIASREFIDNLTSIIKAPAGCNYEVKNRILGLIQTWGQLFRGKHGLGYVCDTYMILQHEGFHFPPADNIGAALVESEAEVRVCDGCWMKKKLGHKSQIALESHGLGGAPEFVHSMGNKTLTSTGAPLSTTITKAATTTPAKSTAAATSSEDEDLKKAIELSLKEANTHPGFSAPKRSNTEPVKKAPVPTQEEEDADLLAAIEASLRETNIRSSSLSSTAAQAPRSTSQRQSSYSSYTYSKKPVTAVASVNELTETEKSNIEMFSVLVDRIQMMQGDVSGNREVQALYEQISKLQMKVALNLEEAARKQQECVGYNDKIDHAVRMYDQLLQEKLNSSYQRRMNSTGYGTGMYQSPSIPQTPQTTHVYPQLAPTANNVDSRYAQYAPVTNGQYGVPQTPQMASQQPYQQPQQPATPLQQQQQIPPQQQQQQVTYQYQTPQPQPTVVPPAPFAVASPDQQQHQYQQQQPQQQQQQQQQSQPYSTTVVSSAPGSQPPASALQNQYGYQPQQQQPQVNGAAPLQVATLPINNTYQPPQGQQQQQQQQPIQSPPAQHQQQSMQSMVPPVSQPQQAQVQPQQHAFAPYDPQQQQQQQQQLAPISQQFSGSTQQHAPQPQVPSNLPPIQAVAQPQYQQQPQQTFAPAPPPPVAEALLIDL